MDKSQKEKIVNYWLKGAKTSFKLSNDVLERKYYDHALFCGHLALEKLLKAVVVEKTDKYAPHSHDLLYLSGLAKIDLTIEQQKFLTQVNTFNIAGRYPEEKLEFYKIATKEFATNQLKEINQFYLWLLKQKEKK
ncbi:HEPN domain-containing protein [Candidatus Parcubacteria bacterium]|nr:HEPN domain-containing protein [Candidatus Parcubacteria bacterium]